MRMTGRLVIALCVVQASEAAAPERELRFSIRADPKTFDPLVASEEASETVRFLTGGVLIRFDRTTQQLQPELAEKWTTDATGRRIDFVLRKGVKFSDGTPFDSADVVATVRRLNDPKLRSGVAETFRGNAGEIRVEARGPYQISLLFPEAIAGLEQLFDQLAIASSKSPQRERAVLGPFTVAEHKGGQYVLLRRNPWYWKTDPRGRKLPYVAAVRLDIQGTRDVELLRFRRGEVHLVDKLEPDTFERLHKDMPANAVDIGPSLDSEVLWFNLVPGAPIPAYKRVWFQSSNFRRAISGSVQRDDIVRLVYRGHARAAAGHFSASNKQWSNHTLRPHSITTSNALRLLGKDGFRIVGQTLTDRAGNAVEFSIVTNASSKPRAQMAAVIQEDLKRIGIGVKIVVLEFGSLIERITQTNQYEACLLGFTNVEPDPNSQANVFLSSGNLHAWNPGQKTPATAWEAEIDLLVRNQTGASTHIRKDAFDRVQQILWDQAPIVYLVHPNVLVAISAALRNAAPSPLPPHLYWNVEYLDIAQ